MDQCIYHIFYYMVIYQTMQDSEYSELKDIMLQKKNILIIVLIILALFSVLYAFIKADEAAKAGEEARITQQYLEEQIEEADKQAEAENKTRDDSDKHAAKLNRGDFLSPDPQIKRRREY